MVDFLLDIYPLSPLVLRKHSRLENTQWFSVFHEEKLWKRSIKCFDKNIQTNGRDLFLKPSDLLLSLKYFTLLGNDFILARDSLIKNNVSS